MESRFDRIAGEWDFSDMRTMIAMKCAKAIKRHLPLKASMHLMDFGAGTGLLSYSLAESVGSVTAVDTSVKMLEVLESKKRESLNVKTHHGDIMHLPMDECFDGIVSSMAMHHVEDTQFFMKTLYDHLQPGGFIAICDLEKEDGTFHSHGNEGVFHFGFDEVSLQKHVEATGFEAVQFFPVFTIEKESGNYPVFLLTALKPDS